MDSDGYLKALCGCGTTYNDGNIFALLGDDAATYSLYKRLVLARQVAANPNLLFCATAGCDSVLTRKKGSKKAQCDKCSHQTCTDCNAQHSRVVPCMVADGNFATWKAGGGEAGQGVKRCPSCRTHIEKSEGCRHMTCTNCRYEFCWHCRGDWSEGCKRMCKMHEVWGSSVWGNSLGKRCVTKTLAAPCVVAVAGVGAGLLAAGAACAVVGATLRLPVDAGVWVYMKSTEARAATQSGNNEVRRNSDALRRNSEELRRSKRIDHRTLRRESSLSVIITADRSFGLDSPAAA